ncbi:MAG: hypothetical protein QM704_16050 [Anaeromyxobacteraceae bacterium]
MKGRSVLAVVAGLVATAALSIAADQALHSAGVYPPWGARMSDGLFGLATAYRVAFTVLGGWITARLAPARPMRHAAWLAAIGTLLGLAGLAVAVANPDLGPRWYPVALVVTAAPCVLLGAWLRARGAAPAGAGAGDPA